MLIESIGYTAMLVEYISRATHLPVTVIAKTIGEAGIFRLAHNAPMNRHLPITQISSEVMSDYGISYKSPDFAVISDEAVSATVISEVQAITSQKSLYAAVLYELLTWSEFLKLRFVANTNHFSEPFPLFSWNARLQSRITEKHHHMLRFRVLRNPNTWWCIFAL